MIKKILFSVVGAAVVFILGAAIMYPINIWYADRFLGGEDHTGRIFEFNVFIAWPIFLLLGATLGIMIYRKRLTSKSSGRKGRAAD